jgi:dipeptidyl aminopeptidase/acylaminoacyl peptidase
MYMKKISLQDLYWNTLVGTITEPTVWEIYPIVLMCHGFPSNSSKSTYVSLEKKLLEVWIAVCRFDFFGQWGSSGNIEDITLSLCLEQTRTVLQYIQKEWYDRIGLFGSSFWGNVSLNLAAENDTVCCVATKAAVSDYQKQRRECMWDEGLDTWKKEGIAEYAMSWWKRYVVKYTFFDDMKYHNIHEKAQYISIPVLLVHGTSDTVVSHTQSEKTCVLLPNWRLELVPEADHKFKKPGEREYINTLFTQFFQTHLWNQ